MRKIARRIPLDSGVHSSYIAPKREGHPQPAKPTKESTAESKAIICFATGDSSISAAMANGGITKIHHVDCKVFSVLGLYARYTTVVYGE